MANPSPRSEFLRPNRALDNPGVTKSTGIRLSPADLEWLDSLGGTRSFHIRQALKVYREQMQASSVVADLDAGA